MLNNATGGTAGSSVTAGTANPRTLQDLIAEGREAEEKIKEWVRSLPPAPFRPVVRTPDGLDYWLPTEF